MIGRELLVLVPGGVCFLAFSWAMLRHFRSVKPMPVGLRLIGLISLATMAAFIWSVLTEPLSEAWPAAPILSIGSLALFGWTVAATRDAGFAVAFARRPPLTLLITGPFRYMRHPFYTSYLIFWLAACIATTSIICELGATVLLLCYHAAARQEEKFISHSRLAAEYESYASVTGMFFPKRGQKR